MRALLSLLLAAAASGHLFSLNSSNDCEDLAEAIYIVQGASQPAAARLGEAGRERVSLVVLETLKGPNVKRLVVPEPRTGFLQYAAMSEVLVYVKEGSIEFRNDCGPLGGAGDNWDTVAYPMNRARLDTNPSSGEQGLGPMRAYITSYVRGRADPTAARLAGLIESTQLPVRRAGVYLAMSIKRDSPSAGWAILGPALARQTRKEPPELEPHAMEQQLRVLLRAIGETQQLHKEGKLPAQSWWRDATLLFVDATASDSFHLRRVGCKGLNTLGHPIACKVRQNPRDPEYYQPEPGETERVRRAIEAESWSP